MFRHFGNRHFGTVDIMGIDIMGIDILALPRFVLGDKSMWDVLSRVSKNGMGCFVLGSLSGSPSQLIQLIDHSSESD